ncbi:MAG: hypothetical protein J2P17_19400 [Mycobacterium sp.]|nr:hypothetical protein [Mycobacterium sp.]
MIDGEIVQMSPIGDRHAACVRLIELNPTEKVWGNLKSQELAILCADTVDRIASYAVDGL